MRAAHAEWTKLRTLSSTAWILATTVLGTIAVSAATVLATDTGHCAAACYEDTVKLSLGGVRAGQAVIVVLAVLTISGEYATGTIGPTLAATPRRLPVLAAKAAVIAATVAVAGLLAVAGSLLAGRLILPGNGFVPPSLTDPLTLRAGLGSVAYLVLIALLALGVALVLRDTAASVTTVYTLLFLAPALTAVVSDPRWHARLEKYAPMTAGLAVQNTLVVPKPLIGPWHGLGVLAAYSAVALVAGGVVFARRSRG
ncbi:ABC transporter [Actinorhabdospora filicis]|uniref:ABC transporter n=1 Tax=Actinorhabdospora filicis TaxID=1785913 RepID=A0A9W6SLD7_9ACTN|nr:ABC transporter permease [Actinorhabdospora filicis]GLZ77927.1 ABC transporter [Actinorhabdospora filicis]